MICGERYNEIYDRVTACCRSGAPVVDAFAQLYAAQGYSREELEEDLKHPNFDSFLSNVIDMSIVEEYFKEKDGGDLQK